MKSTKNTLSVIGTMIVKVKHYTMFPKTSAYVKSYYSETKWMSFLSEDDELVKKYNPACNEVSNSIKK